MALITRRGIRQQDTPWASFHMPAQPYSAIVVSILRALVSNEAAPVVLHLILPGHTSRYQSYSVRSVSLVPMSTEKPVVNAAFPPP